VAFELPEDLIRRTFAENPGLAVMAVVSQTTISFCEVVVPDHPFALRTAEDVIRVWRTEQAARERRCG